MTDTFNSIPTSVQQSKGFLEGRNTLAYVKTTLAALLMQIGVVTAQGQTTTTGEKSAKIEKITSIGNPQQDMADLLKKYNVPSVDDIWEMDFQDMANMRYDLTVLFGKNTTGAYHLDPHVVVLRDELIKNISVLLTSEEERLTFKKDAEKVIGRGITLDKGEKKLSENEKKLSENEKIARQFGIIK